MFYNPIYFNRISSGICNFTYESYSLYMVYMQTHYLFTNPRHRNHEFEIFLTMNFIISPSVVKAHTEIRDYSLEEGISRILGFNGLYRLLACIWLLGG